MLGKAAVPVVVRDATRSGRFTVLLLIAGKPLAQFARYLHARNLSLSGERTYARAVALLIDFIFTHESTFNEISRRRELFGDFSHALRYGTIRDGDDPSGLWWRPRNLENVAHLLNAVCSFSDWLVEQEGTSPLNPRVAFGSVAQKIAYWRRWNTMKYSSLLGHLRDPATATQYATFRAISPPERIERPADRPPYFPRGRFEELLLTGFARKGQSHAREPWRRYVIRDMMIAILLDAGGLRDSEPFHLFVNDVSIDPSDPDVAFVRVFHPSDGTITSVDPISGRDVSTNRAAFLESQFGRRPLHIGTTKNGWKGNAMQRGGNFMPVYWYPRYYGKLFLSLFKMYLTHVRPLSLNHPWLFVSLAGEPLTAKSYAKRHAAAIRRIGLTVSKQLGTTPHGHRHALGQRLQDALDAGLIDRKTFQAVLHHRSLSSQDAYNAREDWKVNAVLNRAGLIDTASVNTQLFSEFSA